MRELIEGVSIIWLADWEWDVTSFTPPSYPPIPIYRATRALCTPKWVEEVPRAELKYGRVYVPFYKQYREMPYLRIRVGLRSKHGRSYRYTSFIPVIRIKGGKKIMGETYVAVWPNRPPAWPWIGIAPPVCTGTPGRARPAG